MQSIIVTSHLLESQPIYEGLKRRNIDSICTRPQSLEGWCPDTDAVIFTHPLSDRFLDVMTEFIEQLPQKIPLIFLYRPSDSFEGLYRSVSDRSVILSQKLELEECVDVIHELLTLSGEEHHDQIVCGPICLNRELRNVEILGKSVTLTKKEFYLMELLTKNFGKPITRERIIDYVWDRRHYVAPNTIDVYVSRLRKKLPKHHHSPIIKTIPCMGYTLQLKSHDEF